MVLFKGRKSVRTSSTMVHELLRNRFWLNCACDPGEYLPK